jgi:hypothetical protein
MEFNLITANKIILEKEQSLILKNNFLSLGLLELQACWKV